jgi:iron complex transport system ATP-binding protein
LGHVVIIVMHDLNLAARYADRMVLLHRGKKIADGPVSDVLTEEHIRHCYQVEAKVCDHPFHHCPIVYFGEGRAAGKKEHAGTTLQKLTA